MIDKVVRSVSVCVTLTNMLTDRKNNLELVFCMMKEPRTAATAGDFPFLSNIN